MNAEIWHVDIYFIIFATEKAIGHHEKKSIVFPFISLSAAWACAGLLDKISVKPFPLLGQLPSNKVYCLHQDREGVLWLGTTDGLCRYDGYGLHVFRSSPMYPALLPHNDIKDIAETKDGKLLIGTQKRDVCVGQEGQSLHFFHRLFVDRL